MRKEIEFKPSVNQPTTALANHYEDLILTEPYRKYRHRFESGKTNIRLLPTLPGGDNWLLQISTLQHSQGRHAHPKTIDRNAKSVFNLAYEYLKDRNPESLYNRSNRSGFRLLPSPMSLCWAIVQDKNGTKLRLILASYYDGSRGGTKGLGYAICSQALVAGEDCCLPGHPINHMDGRSLIVDRSIKKDSKIPQFRVSTSEDRGPIQALLDKITDVEINVLCPLEKTICIPEQDKEWLILAKVVGDKLAGEIRSAHENDSKDDLSATDPDFPAKWEI